MLAPGCPAIQEAAAVLVLITYINRRHCLPVPGSDQDLPEFYRLDPELYLVRDSEEKNVYHVTTLTACSCSAGREPGKPCEHSSRFFPAEEAKAEKVA